MPPAFLSVSGGEERQRPSSAQGRLESGSATRRTLTRPRKQQPATFLSYDQRTPRTARSVTPSPTASASSSALSPARHSDDDEPPSTTWSQRLLSNAQHISPSLAQQYALPTSAPTHATTSHRVASTRTPALANLASRHLPSSPYLQQHLSVLAQQLGSECTQLHATEREEDDAVQRSIKRAVRREMKQQTAQRSAEAEEHKEAEAEQQSDSSPPPVYPFTQHASALREHVLTLSRLQTRFDTLVQSVSRSTSMHQLLSSFSAAYQALFSSLLSTLFSLNHHYHFTLHHASFTLSAQQSEHAASLSSLQQRLRLLSSAAQSSHHLADIEQQQRQHNAQQISHLQSILRLRAADVQRQAHSTAEHVDGATSAVRRDDVLELSGEAFMHSHQLGLLLNALCHEAEEEAAERAKLDSLMTEGRKSAKQMWLGTVAKKREDAAAKQKDRRERERQQAQAAASGSAAAVTPRSWAAGPYAANGFTLLPPLSRFMRGVQTLMAPQKTAASSLDSVNAQLVAVLVALPAAVDVAGFPSHLLSVIMAAQESPQAAQRHLRSLFTHCSAHYQQPLPRLVLPLIATYTGKSVFSSGLTPRFGRLAASPDDAPPPNLVEPAPFTVHVVAESLRFLQPLIAAARDNELCFPVPLLQVQVPALLTLFFQPPGDDSVRSQVLSFLDAQSLLPAASLIDLLLLLASAYHDSLSEFVRRSVGDGAVLGWDELQRVMRTLCTSDTRWEAAGKGEVARVYVEWSARCGELAAAGGDGDVDEVGVLLDVLSLRRWFMTSVHPT